MPTITDQELADDVRATAARATAARAAHVAARADFDAKSAARDIAIDAMDYAERVEIGAEEDETAARHRAANRAALG